VRKGCRRPYVYDPVAAKARQAAHAAAQTLPAPTACEACGRAQYVTVNGRPGVVHHHHSYEPAYRRDCIALCLSCHRRVHCGSLAEPRTGRLYKGTLRVHKPAPARPAPKPAVRLRPPNAELARLRRERCVASAWLPFDAQASQ